MRELQETYKGLDGFQKYLHPYALDESSLSIGRVKALLRKSRWYPIDFTF